MMGSYKTCQDGAGYMILPITAVVKTIFTFKYCSMRDHQHVSLQLSHVVVTVVFVIAARKWRGDGLNLDPLLALSTLCTEHRWGPWYGYRGMCKVTQQQNTQGMSLGGNSINLHALSIASDMCCHLFTNAGDTWSQYLTCSTFPFAALHKFSKNLGPISKLLVPEGWC